MYRPRKRSTRRLTQLADVQDDTYWLISCRAEAWHYRIFPDFLNSGLKMAFKIERKAKVIACS